MSSTDYVSDYLQKYPVMKYILPGIEHNNTEITDKCFILRQAMWTLAKILDYDETAARLPINSFYNAVTFSYVDNNAVGVSANDIELLAIVLSECAIVYNAAAANLRNAIHAKMNNDNSITYNSAGTPADFTALLTALDNSAGMSATKRDAIRPAMAEAQARGVKKSLANRLVAANALKAAVDRVNNAASVPNVRPAPDGTAVAVAGGPLNVTAAAVGVQIALANGANGNSGNATPADNALHIAAAALGAAVTAAVPGGIATGNTNNSGTLADFARATHDLVIKSLFVEFRTKYNDWHNAAAILARAVTPANAAALQTAKADVMARLQELLRESDHLILKVTKAQDAAAKLQQAIMNGNEWRSAPTNMSVKILVNELLQHNLLYDCVKLADGKVYLMASQAHHSYTGAMKLLNVIDDYTLEFDNNGNLVLKKGSVVIDRYDELNKLVRKGEYCRAFGSGSKTSHKEEAVCGEMVFACLGPNAGKDKEKCKAMFKKFLDPSKKLKSWTGLAPTQVARESHDILRGLGFTPLLNEDKSAYTFVKKNGDPIYSDADIAAELFKAGETKQQAHIDYVKLLMKNTENFLPKPVALAQQTVRQRYIPNPVVIHKIQPVVLKSAGLGMIGNIFGLRGGASSDSQKRLVESLSKQLESVKTFLTKEKTDYINKKLNEYLASHNEFLEIQNEVNLIQELKNSLQGKLILSDEVIQRFMKEKEAQQMKVERKEGKLEELSNKLSVIQFKH
jgi:hypothetical protein